MNVSANQPAAATDIGQAFYGAVQSQVQAYLQSTIKVPLYPVQYPAQGDFMWNYQDLNNRFNNGTFGYISGLAGPGQIPGTVALGLADSLPTAYSQTANAITYSLSSANQAKLNQINQQAQTQAASVVSIYQGNFGQITPAMLLAAGVSNNLDYVISYIMGSQWSGATPPVTWNAMQNARNLQSLMPKMPASGQPVLAAVSTYLNILGPSTSLQDQISNGQWVIRQLINNTQAPTAANGGVVVVDPNTGAVIGTDVGYGIGKSLADISNGLANKSAGINIAMSVSQSSSSTLNVSVGGSAGFSVGSFLRFSVGGSASYDMTQISGASTSVQVTMSYPGVTSLPISPTAWNQATNVGWYNSAPIQQAVANGTADVDGFKFTTAQAYNYASIAQGGNFGQLSALVISQFPTISLTYSNANYSSFQQNWKQESHGNLSLFGFISLGSFSQGAYGSSLQQGADNSTFTINFAPSPQLASVPQLQQLAYVVAGAVTNPGAA